MRATTEPVADQAGVLERRYRAEYTGMVRLAYTLVGSNAEAEDLVQDSFVEVSRRLDEIRKPGAYLRSAVVSRCRSALRRRRVMAMHQRITDTNSNLDAGCCRDRISNNGAQVPESGEAELTDAGIRVTYLFEDAGLYAVNCADRPDGGPAVDFATLFTVSG